MMIVTLKTRSTVSVFAALERVHKEVKIKESLMAKKKVMVSQPLRSMKYAL